MEDCICLIHDCGFLLWFPKVTPKDWIFPWVWAFISLTYSTSTLFQLLTSLLKEVIPTHVCCFGTQKHVWSSFLTLAKGREEGNHQHFQGFFYYIMFFTHQYIYLVYRKIYKINKTKSVKVFWHRSFLYFIACSEFSGARNFYILK